MSSAIFDERVVPFRTNVHNARTDSIVVLIDGAAIVTASLAPGYAVERTGVGEYTLTVPKAQDHTVVALCDAENNIFVDYSDAKDGTIVLLFAGGDPVGQSTMPILVCCGDVA